MSRYLYGDVARWGTSSRGRVHTAGGRQVRAQPALPKPPGNGQLRPERERHSGALRGHLRSTADHDTHCGTLQPDGAVTAQRSDRLEAYLEFLATAVTRREAAYRVMQLVLALAEEPTTLTTAQLRALAARVRPG